MMKIQAILTSLTAADIDVFKTAAFLAAFFINRQAAAIFAAHILNEMLFHFINDGLILSLSLAFLYSILASSTIKLDYKIRQALICIALINWLSAVDFFLFPYETWFYLCYPWIINGLDVFILISLIGYGAGDVIEIVTPVAALAIIFALVYNCARYVVTRFSDDKRKRLHNSPANDD